MAMRHNTPSEPCTSPTCADVPKTFLNEVGCGYINGRESCGSPGEVGSVPSLAHRFGIITFNRGERYRNLYRPVTGSSAYRQMVHNNIAITAPDQLRQRVAFALSQVVVAAAGANGDTEQWVCFYDIFVRNAFGNYGDVLREAVYSPVMGDWLRCALAPLLTEAPPPVR